MSKDIGFFFSSLILPLIPILLTLELFALFITTIMPYLPKIRWDKRAKMLWAEKDELNTSFFGKFANICKHRSKMLAILDDQMRMCIEQCEIENCFINFYNSLWTSSYYNTS